MGTRMQVADTLENTHWCEFWRWLLLHQDLAPPDSLPAPVLHASGQTNRVETVPPISTQAAKIGASSCLQTPLDSPEPEGQPLSTHQWAGTSPSHGKPAQAS